ncbi:unnamed protein product [Bursaphelenchus okinawaensis]|uniref:Uncharacterized protein n=1 Tax=Bursaphelenchus okinawaensis TaxID=465554 RepID=A0A811KVX9_9BILA|nr:unnamed protein product [Bursaphelenchus okinawaensis]CAG9112569.1 unnamed protein product [Bursaphelenchus okinawaensis]
MSHEIVSAFLTWWLKCPPPPDGSEEPDIENEIKKELAKTSPLAQALYSFVLAMILFYVLLLLRNFYYYFFYPVWQMRPVSHKRRRSRGSRKSDIHNELRTAIMNAQNQQVKMNSPVAMIYKRRSKSTMNSSKGKNFDILTPKTARSPQSGSPKSSTSERDLNSVTASMSSLSSDSSKASDAAPRSDSVLHTDSTRKSESSTKSPSSTQKSFTPNHKSQ